MKHAILSVSVVLLASCATSPVKVSESREIPSQRRLSGFAAVSQPSADKATVIVIRDAGLLGAGAPAKLLVDGAPVARLWSGERVQFYVTGGDHIFGVKPDPQLTGALTENSFSLAAGHTYHFRISVSESSLRIQPSSQLD
jgi:hypothetical protein